MSLTFGRSFSHHSAPGILWLLPAEGVGLPRDVVSEISCQCSQFKARSSPSAELWPGTIRAEIQLSDGGGLARRPCWLTAEAMEAPVTHLGLYSLCVSAHSFKVLTLNPHWKLVQRVVLSSVVAHAWQDKIKIPVQFITATHTQTSCLWLCEVAADCAVEVFLFSWSLSEVRLWCRIFDLFH